MSDGGKGSKQRPGKGYEDNYDRIFGKKPLRFDQITKANPPSDLAWFTVQELNRWAESQEEKK
jgi:hypothetical protein